MGNGIFDRSIWGRFHTGCFVVVMELGIALEIPGHGDTG